MKYSFPTLYLYNNVFYPETVIPLNVNDDVSKEVLAECYDRNMPLVFYHPSNRLKKIGTIGRILMLERHPDCTMALIEGKTRVQLFNQKQHLPFPVYQIDDYADEENEKSIDTGDSIERLHQILVNWINRHITSAKEREIFLRHMSSTQSLVNYLCLLIIKDIELKEIFLENTSLSDRIRMMDALLRGSSPEIEDVTITEAIKNFEQMDQKKLTNFKNFI